MYNIIQYTQYISSTYSTVVEDLSSKSAVSLESTSSNTSLTTDSSRVSVIYSCYVIMFFQY